MKMIEPNRILRTQLVPINAFPVLFWMTRCNCLAETFTSRYSANDINRIVRPLHELNTNKIYLN